MPKQISSPIDNGDLSDYAEYGDRLEIGFAILSGREICVDFPEDSNGSDYDFDYLNDEEYTFG